MVNCFHISPCVMPLDIHRDDVEHHAEQRDPEVLVRQLRGPELRVVEPREQPIEHAERQEPVPTQRAGVDVGDGPVGVVRERVDALDRQHRAFEVAMP